MSRWSSLRRTVAPRSRQSERRPPPATRAFTTDEIRVQRLALAQDMVRLVLKDDGPLLPAPVQERLQQVSAALGTLQRQTRTLP
jgi:hypothetical protein